VIDVAAEAVQEIQAIVTQPLSPPGGRRLSNTYPQPRRVN
jgi:hypothetical protein